MKIVCVYKITSPSGKVYVGSTINYRERLSSYKRLDCKQQARLYNSFIKYGFENHLIDMLENCVKDNVREREAYYGKIFDVLGRKGLNHRLPKINEKYSTVSDEWRIANGIRKKGNKNCLGRKATTEQKQYLSDIRKGVPRPLHSNDTKNKMSKSAMGGKNHKAIMLLNVQTGIFYECFRDAANSIGMNYNTFRSNLYHGRCMPFIRA